MRPRTALSEWCRWLETQIWCAACVSTLSDAEEDVFVDEACPKRASKPHETHRDLVFRRPLRVEKQQISL